MSELAHVWDTGVYRSGHTACREGFHRGPWEVVYAQLSSRLGLSNLHDRLLISVLASALVNGRLRVDVDFGGGLKRSGMLTHGIEVQVMLSLSVHEEVGLWFRGRVYPSLGRVELLISDRAIVFGMQLGCA